MCVYVCCVYMCNGRGGSEHSTRPDSTGPEPGQAAANTSVLSYGLRWTNGTGVCVCLCVCWIHVLYMSYTVPAIIGIDSMSSNRFPQRN